MKAIQYSIIFLSIAISGLGQQLPQFTNYMQNDYLINTAAAGKNDFFEISALNRYQWVGIQDAPRTFTVTVAGPNKKRNMGFGGQVFTDIAGPTRRFGGRASYAYHIKLGLIIKLSFSGYLGILQYGIDASKVRLGTTDIPDIISTNYQRSIVPDIGASAYLYQKDKFYFGVAFPQMFKANLKFEKKIKTNSNLSTLLAAHGGYTFDIGNNMGIEPSFLMKYEAGAPINLNFGLRAIYDKQHWLGLMYKGADGQSNQYAKGLFAQNNIKWTKGESVCLLVGMTYKKYLSVGYAYDYTISRLASYNSGSHEVILTLLINKAADKAKNKKRDKALAEEERINQMKQAEEQAKADKIIEKKKEEEAKQKAKEALEQKLKEEKLQKEQADKDAAAAKEQERAAAEKKAKEEKAIKDKLEQEENERKAIESKDKKVRKDLDLMKKESEQKKAAEEAAKKAAEEKAKKDLELKLKEEQRLKEKAAADKIADAEKAKKDAELKLKDEQLKKAKDEAIRKEEEQKKFKEIGRLKQKAAAEKAAKEAKDALEKEQNAKEAIRLKGLEDAAKKAKEENLLKEAQKKKEKDELDKQKAAEKAEFDKMTEEQKAAKRKEKETLDKQREAEKELKRKEEEAIRKQKAKEKAERDEENKKKRGKNIIRRKT